METVEYIAIWNEPIISISIRLRVIMLELSISIVRIPFIFDEVDHKCKTALKFGKIFMFDPSIIVWSSHHGPTIWALSRPAFVYCSSPPVPSMWKLASVDAHPHPITSFGRRVFIYRPADASRRDVQIFVTFVYSALESKSSCDWPLLTNVYFSFQVIQ